MGPKVIKKNGNWFKRHKVFSFFAVFVVLAVAGFVSFMVYNARWYEQNILPLSNEQSRIRVTIEPGLVATEIGQLLESEGVIKSGKAFEQYVTKTGIRNELKAGVYLFSPSQSVEEIATMIANGEIDQFQITITPGQRLDDIRTNLIDAGFDESELDAALSKKYDLPLFEGKPDDSDLEGYIFPDTYTVVSEATPEQFLIQIFNNFYSKIETNNLEQALSDQDLSLFEGITLASIVQLEVSNKSDQEKVAQVFTRRLREDIPLGADPTFKYAAYKLGQEPTIGIDSPYNTRIYKGLPPGPIANFNIGALEAVAFPADTDYLYFVAGDDGTTYFSHTEEEHENLTRQHCTTLCQ